MAGEEVAWQGVARFARRVVARLAAWLLVARASLGAAAGPAGVPVGVIEAAVVTADPALAAAAAMGR